MHTRFLGALWLTVVLLSGCLGGDGPSGGPAASSSTAPTVEPTPGVTIPADKGAVLGRIVNDAGIPVRDVVAALLGTPHGGRTNQTGHYQILDIPPGEYRFRADKAGFRAHEEPVSVVAGNVTRVDVVLVPLSGEDDGARPHVHDLWGEELEYVLMDGTVTLDQTPGNCGVIPRPGCDQYWANANGTTGEWPLILPAQAPKGGPALVLPGTREFVITLSWESTQITVDKMGIMYRDPLMPGGIRWKPTANSGTAVRHAVNESTADNGHARSSQWLFWLYTDNSPASSLKPGVVTPGARVHVKIVLHKGEMYLEREHPDFWKGNDSLVLRSKDRTQKYPSGTLPLWTRTVGGEGTTLDAGIIVPPGTKRMRIDFAWSYEGAAGPEFDHDLTWRTADQHVQTTPVSQYRRATGTPNGTNAKVYDFDVDPKWVDGYYHKKSNWLFVPWVHPFPEEGTQPTPRITQVRIGITVYKDPSYAE